MSYILDALKKAEAEREGAVPTNAGTSIHAPPAVVAGAGMAGPGESAGGRQGQPLTWAVAGLSVTLAGVLLAWWLAGRSPAPAADVVVADAGTSRTSADTSTPPSNGPPQTSSQPPVTPRADAAPATVPAITADTDQASMPPLPPGLSAEQAAQYQEAWRNRPPSREELQDETPPPVMAPSPVPARQPAAGTRSASLPSSTTGQAARHQGDAVSTAAKAAAPARVVRPAEQADAGGTTATAGAQANGTGNSPNVSDTSRVYALNELPEAIRRQLPQMSVGGAMYSEHAASRMLILNGQLFHEGDRPMANLKLEQINLKFAVLSYKGYRYSISY